jgi:transcriptional regulator with XRE-family HTH domain
VEEAHRPNELLRRARLLRGWSQQRVADHINAPNRQLVYRWETGKRSPGPFYRERLCQEFKMTAQELGLVELPIPNPADPARTVAGDRAGGTTDGAGDSLLPESVNVLLRELWRDEVKRRTVLQMLAALAAGAALDRAPLQRPPVVPVAHASEVADHLARAFPELSTEDWLFWAAPALAAAGALAAVLWVRKGWRLWLVVVAAAFLVAWCFSAWFSASSWTPLTVPFLKWRPAVEVGLLFVYTELAVVAAALTFCYPVPRTPDATGRQPSSESTGSRGGQVGGNLPG